MSDARVFKTSEDGSLVWKTMTPDRIAGAMDVMRQGFLPYECVSIALMLVQNEAATKDFLHICDLVAQDGASLVAIHVPSDRVVGVAFNKIQSVPEDGESTFMDVLASTCCNDPASSAIVEFLTDVDGRVNVFEKYAVNSLLEHMFLAVLPEFRGKKIAHFLTKCTEEMAQCLMKGQVAVENKNSENIGLVMAVFTSRFSQHIGQSLQWDELARIGHDEYTFQGKKFSERIGPQHPDNLLMAKRIV